jgi:chemotaxis protein CheD
MKPATTPMTPMTNQPGLHDLAQRVAQALVRPPTARPAPAAQPPVVGWCPAKPGATLSLMPGELWFGREAASVRTLLGSCVALTLWHPRLRLGGMCHYLLPGRQRKGGEPLDGRYGDEAVHAMVNLLERHGCRSGEFVAHLYGGADTMSDVAGVKFNVGERNIERGWSLLDHFAFSLEGVDVGDNVPRTVTLNLDTGAVECRRGNPQQNP